MFSLRFPYQKGTLNGLFGVGIRKLKLDIKYEANLSSYYDEQKYPTSHRFDGNAATFCHTAGTSNIPQYLEIHFIETPFKIEGFAMQNRNSSGWDPLNYVIQGSNDGKIFKVIKDFQDVSTEVCKPNLIRTNRVYTSAKYHYFRLNTTSRPCNAASGSYFNLAEFDLFGTFGSNLCNITLRRRLVFIPSIFSILLFMFSC